MDSDTWIACIEVFEDFTQEKGCEFFLQDPRVYPGNEDYSTKIDETMCVCFRPTFPPFLFCFLATARTVRVESARARRGGARPPPPSAPLQRTHAHTRARRHRHTLSPPLALTFSHPHARNARPHRLCCCLLLSVTVTTTQRQRRRTQVRLFYVPLHFIMRISCSQLAPRTSNLFFP